MSEQVITKAAAPDAEFRRTSCDLKSPTSDIPSARRAAPADEPVQSGAVTDLVEAATRKVFAPDPLADPGSALADVVPTIDPAAMAAACAGVDVRAVDTHLDVAAAVQVLDRVFSPGAGHRFYPPSLLRNLLAAGAPVLLAWDREHPVGVVLALPAWATDSRPLLQSGPMAVLPAARGRGVSVALKLAQRACAVERGVTEIHWSFDAMVAVNARLNLRRLGATVEAFLPGYEGIRHPADATALPHDRLLVAWQIADATASLPDPDAASCEPGWAVKASSDGWPELDRSWSVRASVRVAVPADVSALRRAAPSAASAWQHTVGQVLREAIAGGWRVGWDSRGGYRLTAPE